MLWMYPKRPCKGPCSVSFQTSGSFLAPKTVKLSLHGTSGVFMPYTRSAPRSGSASCNAGSGTAEKGKEARHSDCVAAEDYKRRGGVALAQCVRWPACTQWGGGRDGSGPEHRDQRNMREPVKNTHISLTLTSILQAIRSDIFAFRPGV